MTARRVGLLLLAAALAAGFVALGGWQIERGAWKRDLIARVDARVRAAPVPAPGPARWAGMTRAGDEYRRVALVGGYLRGHDSYVTAATALGSGYWVLTPFVDQRGFTVLVNRGFVPGEQRGRAARESATSITGLLRWTEPRGGFLRDNDPAHARWYSRDVAVIAAAQHLGQVAPYFVDAGAGSTPGAPVGGLTVIRFPDNHLVYAITWFALAVLCLLGGWRIWREKPRAAAQAGEWSG